MPYIVIENFAAGLDTRRNPMVAPPGSLRRCTNAHITRGAEIAKRRAFVPAWTLPPGTRSLAVARNAIFVFGSGAPPPDMPAEVNYQRLEHPGGQVLLRVLSYDVFGGKIYAVAQFVDGSIFHYYDGVRVTDWYDGRARAAFSVVNGAVGAFVSSIKIGGIEVLGVQVDWLTSDVDMAQAIVDQINGFASFPEYDASRVDNRINIAAREAGDVDNGKQVQIFYEGALTVEPESTSMGGGAEGTAFVPGTYVKTAQTKMYAVSGTVMHYSGVAQPTRWTTDITGAGFINMENQDGQSDALMALERYYTRMAVFGRRAVQIWEIDPDPAKVVQVQVLRNSGLMAPQSVEQVGDADVFYLSDSGIRSLRARDSSNAAAVNDIGTPIDETIVPLVQVLGPASVAEAVSLIEPVAGRYWLVLNGQIFVFTNFPGNKVAAWSSYSPGFVISDFAVVNEQIVARSGDTLYRYGGQSGEDWDDSLVEVELPLLDCDKPAHFKKWFAIDMVCEGQWRIYIGFEPLNPEARELIAEVDAPTLSQQRIALEGYGTHASIKFEHDGVEPARISTFILHYELADAG